MNITSSVKKCGTVLLALILPAGMAHTCMAQDQYCPGVIMLLLDQVASPDVITCFGDSITEGHCGVTAYPTKLAILQPEKIVYNTGIGGEQARHAVSRINSVLESTKPNYIIILYGFNDLFDQRQTPSQVVANLRTMVQTSKAYGAKPIISTLLPTTSLHSDPNDLFYLNQEIRAMAYQEQITLVDMNVIFLGSSYNLLCMDGVHPNETGTQLMADNFNQAIPD